MRRQLSLVLTLAAWLLATGSHWDLVQAFAWGRMITTYSHSMPLLQAVQKTFSGDSLCGVCEIVQGAQRDEGNAKASAAKAPERLLFISTVERVTPHAPRFICAGLLPDGSALASADRAVPPLPPPRVAS